MNRKDKEKENEKDEAILTSFKEEQRGKGRDG